MNPLRISYELAAAVSNGLATAQALLAAGNLTLNGSLVSGGVGTLDSGGASRRVVIGSAADDSALTWTVYGTDRYDNTQSESFAGATAGNSVYSTYDYKTVTRIHGSAATAGNVTAGTNAIGSTQWFIREWMSMGTLGVLLYVAAGKTVTASFEVTLDDPNAIQDLTPYQASPEPQSAIPPVAVSPTGWSGLSASKIEMVDVPHFAFRLTITAGTDPAVLQVIETVQAREGSGQGGL